MLSPTRIGIVGGGASAVCLLDALSQRDEVPEAVTVFDPSPHPWRGRAYQPDSAVLWVNAPPEDMTVRAHDPGHFARWLQARRSALGARADYTDPRSGISFAPRAVYGDYLEQSARGALNRLAVRGSAIVFVRKAVTDLARDKGAFVARTADGAPYPLDHVVLCVGNGAPADPHGLSGTPGFVPEPYPVASRLSGIDAGARVVVVGSGLTAVDAVLALTAAGHEGSIVLASRRGVLPSVRQRFLNHELRHFTMARFRTMLARGETLTVAGATALMGDELTAAGSGLERIAHEITSAHSEDAVERLRRGIDAVDDTDPGMRILQRAVPESGPDVWQLLPEQDRTLLLRHHYRTIMTLCCPMPAASAATLLRLADSGQLAFTRGVGRITKGSGGFEVHTADGFHRADVVINAVSPPGHRVPPAAEALITSLTERGLATRHPRGGVSVTRATSGLSVEGVTDKQLYALGDLTSGSLFFTFGIPSLVDRAVDIADAIHRDATRHAVAMQTV